MNNIYQLMNWVENNRGIAALIVLYAQFVILFNLYMYVRLKSPAGRGKLDGGKILTRSRNMQIAASPPSLRDAG